MRKVSYSSDEVMDTSDETADFNMSLITAGTQNQHPPKEKTVEEHADELVREAERLKAKALGIEGNNLLTDNNISNIPSLRNTQNVNIVLIDNDYQMIDAHVDEGLRKKILAFEYVDLNKLLNKNHAGKEGRIDWSL